MTEPVLVTHDLKRSFTQGDVTIEVVAERGWARLDAFDEQLALYSNRASKAQWVGWGANMDLGLMRDFVAMIAEGREPSITGRDGLKALAVIAPYYTPAIPDVCLEEIAMSCLRSMIAAFCLVSLTVTALAQQEEHATGLPAVAQELHPGLGDYAFPITTSVPANCAACAAFNIE